MRKESSDELNPAAVLTQEAAAPRGMRSVRDYFALTVATVGVGYLPVAPGTWGSLVGVGIYAVARANAVEAFGGDSINERSAFFVEALRVSCLLITVVVLSIAGVWAASHVERFTNRKDSGIIVIDEVVGQLVAFLFVPFDAGVWALIAGFFAFRLFDIWKPYPIRRLEKLESGLGVMADDLLAGAYAAVLMAALVSIYYLL